MHKPKILIAFTLILTALLALTACGGEVAVDPPEVNTDVQSEMPAGDNNTVNEMEEVLEEEPAPEEPEAPPEPTAPVEEPAATVSFSADVQPILDSRCANCHGGERVEGGFILLTYADLMAGGDEGLVIVPGDAANSLLAQLIESGKMPKRGGKLNPAQIQTILDWINEGALDN
jgi:mono/diheme cytochrome c family protein